MKKIAIYISLICIVSMQASENKQTRIDTVDQLRRELRRERKENNHNSALDHLMSTRGRPNHDTDGKKAESQKKENV